MARSTKKTRSRCTVFLIPVYSLRIVFMFCADAKKGNRYMAKHGFTTKIPEDSVGYAGREIIKTESGEVHKMFLYIHHSIADFDTPSHECFHLVQDILELRDIKFKHGGQNESYAYLMGYLNNLIITQIIKWKL